MQNYQVIEKIIDILREWENNEKKSDFKRSFTMHQINDFGDKLFYLVAERKISFEAVGGFLPNLTEIVEVKTKFRTSIELMLESFDKEDEQEEKAIDTVLRRHELIVKKYIQQIQDELDDKVKKISSELGDKYLDRYRDVL
jgi:hypothetical protein